MRGIRGAITVKKNERHEILRFTEKLLDKIIRENNIDRDEIVSIIFTATSDLNKVYPAVAARKMGFTDVPLMCYQELSIEGSLERCIRIMLYINRDCKHAELNHIYLEKAKELRPDLVDNKG